MLFPDRLGAIWKAFRPANKLFLRRLQTIEKRTFNKQRITPSNEILPAKPLSTQNTYPGSAWYDSTRIRGVPPQCTLLRYWWRSRSESTGWKLGPPQRWNQRRRRWRRRQPCRRIPCRVRLLSPSPPPRYQSDRHAPQAQYSLRQVVRDDRRPPTGLEQRHHVFPRLDEGVTVQSDKDERSHVEEKWITFLIWWVVYFPEGVKWKNRCNIIHILFDITHLQHILQAGK